MAANVPLLLQAVSFTILLTAVAVCDIRRRIIPDMLCAGIALTSLLAFEPKNLAGALIAVIPLVIARFADQAGAVQRRRLVGADDPGLRMTGRHRLGLDLGQAQHQPARRFIFQRGLIDIRRNHGVRDHSDLGQQLQTARTGRGRISTRPACFRPNRTEP